MKTTLAGAATLLAASAQLWAACGEGGTTAGGITNVPTLGTDPFNLTGINSAGQIAGYSGTLDGSIHAFLFDGGTIDLGTFGGTLSRAYGINASGQIVGEANIAGDSATHAFLYSGGSLIDLGTLGGSYSSARGINAAGQIVGVASLEGDGTQQAFLYSGGTMTSLGDLGGGYSSATAINNLGQITGDSSAPTGDNHAFLYAEGALVDLGDLGGGYSTPIALNDSGVVVGMSLVPSGDFHAFIYSGGTLTDIGTLGGPFSSAVGVNNLGMVVGTSWDADFNTKSFVYQDGTLTDIGTLGGLNTVVSAINNLGQAVGQSDLADSTTHAFVWQNGTLTDLNSILPSGSGYVLTSALLINDDGKVVCSGTYNDQPQWFAVSLGNTSGSNQPPVAVAGPNQSVSCSTVVTLDGSASTDPDGDHLNFVWSEGPSLLGTNAVVSATFDLGVHNITLTVTDQCGSTASTNVTVTVSDTTAPVIVGGPAPITVTTSGCSGLTPNVASQIVASDTCTPSSQLVITQSPVAGTPASTGTHTIIVTVSDASGNIVQGSTTFTVVETTKPTISQLSTKKWAVADAITGKAVVPNFLSGATFSDNCTPANQLVKAQSPAAGTVVGVGTNVITVTVTDASGNTTTKTTQFLVIDETDPVVHSISASPSVLSPANGQLVPVTISVSATDNADANPKSKIVGVYSSDYIGCGDAQITGDLTVKLAASSNNNFGGFFGCNFGGSQSRVYTIVLQTTDASHNVTCSSVNVTVANNSSSNPGRPGDNDHDDHDDHGGHGGHGH